MNVERLYQILKDSTKVYRKGEEVEVRKVGNLEVTELFGYGHTSEAPTKDNFDKVDMIFVDVVVDKTKANKYKAEFERILKEYPQPERLAGGPSYIELSPNLELSQEYGLRLMALGKVLGLWDVVSAKTLGLDDATARQMAGRGFLMITGYKVE